ncbi:THAP domain-containing 6 [Paramuricea clavata]|uniref:THAP domain-containing 6 n=1 Tax=Paramuricea clavata TaxID=317549 RepID=A0A7D9DVJ2_PARCT|nr:THAP domain-containing 6 [Paramuricea clavata]
MPANCCVPKCTKKGSRDENGSKISYYKFPDNSTIMKRKWIHAIRRDEGRDFTITKWTKVCSRHFRDYDFQKTLNGRRKLRPNAIPSQFEWTRMSPRKRNAPTVRVPIIDTSNPNDNFSRDLNLETSTSDGENNNEITIDCPLKDVETQTVSNQIDTAVSSFICQNAPINANAGNDNTEKLKQQLLDYERDLKNAKLNILSLEQKVFTAGRFKDHDSSVRFYTGFANWRTFIAIFNYLNPGRNGENIKYWYSDLSQCETSDDNNITMPMENKPKLGRQRNLKPLDEFFAVMCRLRQGFHEEHLANLFGVSTATISRILISWINFMYLKLGQLNIWPSREAVDKFMPESFKKKYPSTRVIIDCTEVRCQMPNSLHLNGELFSNYKHHTTFKGLIGISPGGAVTFISQLYTGSISDREIVIRSGFLKLPFQNDDSVMADKGFTIEDVLPLGVLLNIPPFLGQSSQMSAKDVVKTEEIASLRIHVERAINKIKNFHIWDSVIPLSQVGILNQMWTVCAILCNAQPNIIST